jgi:competence protein ComEC
VPGCPDVLKVGHHGSAYSSTPQFLAAVRPRYALKSVGRHNLFGHPAASTLANLRDAGTTAYRTDRCGAITVEGQEEPRVTATIACVEPPPHRIEEGGCEELQ